MRSIAITELPEHPVVAVVIPTIGTHHDLDRLLQSLEDQTHAVSEIVVVAQGGFDSVARSVARFPALPVRTLTCDPGLSGARNRGIAALTSRWTIVAIPDDDVWYEPGTIARVVEEFTKRGFGAASARVLRAGLPSRLAFPVETVALGRRSVWRGALEPGLFLTRHLIEDVGGFREDLGLGAATPWQSGEGTDLLLRALRRGHEVRFISDARVWEDAPPRTGATSARRVRRYARGTGFVYRRHYSPRERAAFILRSFGRAALTSTRGTAGVREAVGLLVGRVEGVTGWLLTRS